MNPKQKKRVRTKLNITITMLALAVITIATASYAWFTLSMNSTVKDMTLNVTTGDSLKISTVFETDILKYVNVVENDKVNAQLKLTEGFDKGLEDILLTPLTSGNGKTFYTKGMNESSTEITKPIDLKTRKYMELTLWFLGTQDMQIYLTDSGDDGTKITSVEGNSTQQQQIINCVRISMTPYKTAGDTLSVTEGDYSTAGATLTYEPNKNGVTTLKGRAKSDNGAKEEQTTFSDMKTKLFDLKQNVPTKVVFSLWIEGEDAQCDDEVQRAKVAARLKFSAADSNGVPLS